MYLVTAEWKLASGATAPRASLGIKAAMKGGESAFHTVDGEEKYRFAFPEFEKAKSFTADLKDALPPDARISKPALI